jgi:hypothetical protein
LAGESHEQVVDVFATIAPDPSDPQRWLAQTINRNNPRVAGLFAYGRDFTEARANLAQVVFLAMGDGGGVSRRLAVIIFATTVKTFRAAPTIVEAASATAADD